MSTFPLLVTLAVLVLSSTINCKVVFPVDEVSTSGSEFNHSALFNCWSHLTGPSYSLKLLRAMNIAANATSTVISPLAFKLTLLGLSTVSNPATESAINQLLFDEPTLLPTSLNQLLTPEGQNFVRTQMNLTAEVSRRKTGGSGSVKEQLSGLLKPLVGSAADPNYQLCMNFKEGMNAGLAALCTGYISGLPFLPKDPQSLLQLTARQEIQLCQAFGINNYPLCIDRFLNSPKLHYGNNFPILTNFTTAELAVQLLELFHQSTNESDASHNYSHLYRASFVNDELQTKTVWADMLNWFGMTNFGGLHKSMDKWVEWIKSRLDDQVTKPTSSLLNIVQISQKWPKSFSNIGAHVFYSSANATPTEMIYKQDTFSWINHGPETYTPDSKAHLLVRIPLEDPKYSIVLMVPAEEKTVGEMLGEISSEQMTYYLKRLQLDEKEIRLTMPKLVINGTADFGPILEAAGLSSMELTRASANLSEPIIVSGSLKQVVQMSNYGMVESTWSRLMANYYGWLGKGRVVEEIKVNRPFVYMLVGRYLDLNLMPAFDVLVAGSYYGPDATSQM